MIPIARVEMHNALRNPAVIVFMFLAPGLLIGFAGPGVQGGAAQAYAGMTVLFLFFAVSQAGFSVYREHGWGTWNRIRTTPMNMSVVVIAKLLPYALLGLLQFAVLIVLGRLLLGIERIASMPQLAVIAVTATAAMIGLTVLLLAVTSNIQLFTSLASMMAILLGGLAGAFSPVDRLPGWAQFVAHSTPQYWAIEGVTESLEGGSWGSVLPNAGLLVGFALMFALIGAWRFDLRSSKRSYGTN